MNKNTVLAFLLIALILILMPEYYRMIGLVKDRPLEETTGEPSQNDIINHRNSTTKIQETTTPKSFVAHTPLGTQTFPAKPDSIPEAIITIETDLYTATVSSRGGGTLQSFLLNNYDFWNGGKVDLVDTNQNGGNPLLAIRLGASVDTLTSVFSLEDYRGGEVLQVKREPLTLTYYFNDLPSGIRAIKKLTFLPNSYLISVDAEVVSGSVTPEIHLLWSGGLPFTEKNVKDDITYLGAILYQGGEIFKLSNSEDKSIGSKAQTAWAAVRTKYFISALIPEGGAPLGEISTTKTGETSQFNAQLGFYGSQAETNIFLGPLRYDLLTDLGVGLEQTMSLGWSPIRPIGKSILWILTNLYSIIPNYGVLLIVFSILVKVLLHPLTRKSYKSTKEMQAIQPLITELRQKYKGDPQRLNQETMKLYKEHGVNPLGGCLPMLLQMPILIALFTVFRSTIEFRGAPFILWISDLSQPDQLFNLPFTIPFLGWNTFNVLPILMGATMIYQQKTMSVQSPSQQKSFMYIMNGFFLIIFYSFPSGLNLYYTCFNLLTIFQQKYMIKSPPPATLTKGK
ncbi:MAG: membrane protein insertase YidC [Fidelibacterota bacterium]